jgi:hypothetical protein
MGSSKNSHEGDEEIRRLFWEEYVKQTAADDEEIIKGWSEDLDIVLIFVRHAPFREQKWKIQR